jgi:hypothetical protein
MKTLLDNLLVGAAILSSAVYAVAKLGPRSLRRRMLAALSRRLAAAPSFLGLARVSKSLAAAAAGKAQGACGGCDDCGTETKPAPQSSSAQSSSAQSGASAQSPAEIKVPVADIGRRA